MKKPAVILLVLGTLVYLVSIWTNLDYVWDGIRECWLRGWENAQIDDMVYRDHLRELPASTNPQPWPEGPLWGKATLEPAGQAWLENSETASFLVLQNDSLVFERYLMGHDLETRTNSFSVAKSITAMAVGHAVTKGLVKVDDPLGAFLPRFGEGDDADLTVEEVLQMRSNISFGEDYKDPIGFQAKAYYREDNRTLLQPYRVNGQPGAPFEYQGGNTMLLGEMLDAVRPGNLSNDIHQALWEPMGAEHAAYWGLDGNPEDGAVERSFAQFYATTRDYARFGQLLLDTGSWKGTQLLYKAFVTDMLTPMAETTDAVDTQFYGYQIWLGTTDDGLAFSCMEGLRGQFVLSIPALDAVVVRSGYDKRKAKKRDLPVDIYAAIEAARGLF